MKFHIIFGPLCALALSGCVSELDRLELEKASLTRINTNVQALAALSEGGDLSPSEYDLHVKIAEAPLNEMLASLGGLQFPVEDPSSGRKFEFFLYETGLDFRPGSSVLTIDALLYDPKTGVRAKAIIDGQFTVFTNENGNLAMKVEATRIVPDVSWRGINITRWRFARRVAEIEIATITQKLPSFALPLESDIELESEGESTTETIPTGRGSMTGTQTTIGYDLSGKVVIEQIVFLDDAVHFLGNVEESR